MQGPRSKILSGGGGGGEGGGEGGSSVSHIFWGGGGGGWGAEACYPGKIRVLVTLSCWVTFSSILK